MQWIGRVWDGVRGAQRREWVRRASDASLALVWRRVSDRAPGMPPNVARGYIRARAAGVVSRAVAQVMLATETRRAVDLVRLERDVLEDVVERLAARIVAHPVDRVERRAA